MTIDVLGSQWEIVLCSEDKDPALAECDGYTDSSVRRIVIDDMTKHADDPMGKHSLTDYQKKVMRHEIVHAFLAESGLDGNGCGCDHWEYCEEMVDWWAIQGLKVFKAWESVGAI